MKIAANLERLRAEIRALEQKYGAAAGLGVSVGREQDLAGGGLADRP